MTALRSDLTYLARLDEEIERRVKSQDPLSYGLPDLLRPQQGDETDRQFVERQNREIKDLIEQKLWIFKDARKVALKLSPPMVKFIADMFYRRSNQAILWKGRGCLLPDDWVITSGGMKSFKDVRPGDDVLNGDGDLTRVLDSWSRRYSGEIVDVDVCGNGQTIGFTPDHLVRAIKTRRCSSLKVGNGGKTVCTPLCPHGCRDRSWESYCEDWVAVGDLKAGDLVAVPAPKSDPMDFDVVLRGTANQNWSGEVRFRADDDFFRLVGYYLSEGDHTVRPWTGRIRLAFESGKDDEWIEDVRAIIGRLTGLKVGIERQGKKVSVRVASKSLAEFMSRFGKGRSKGADLGLLRRASDSQIENMLVGMLRGDGHWDGTSVRVSWCSPKMVSTFMYGCWRLGYTPSVRRVAGQDRKGCVVNRSGPQFYMQVAGDDGRKLAALAWRVSPKGTRNNPGGSKRRWSMLGKVYSRVDRVSRREYSGPVWDMTVESGQSFTLPYVVAHNSGGTLCAAILVWLCLVYHRMSFTSMGGSTEQAKLIYQYTKSFWGCFPLMSNALLETEPLQMETRLKTGVILKIISASEKQSRGKHNPGFIVDESSILPGTPLQTDRGFRPIEEIGAGDRVLGRTGVWQTVVERIVHPYEGRAIRIVPYGSSVPCWVTEEHRIWGVGEISLTKEDRWSGRTRPHRLNLDGRSPDWIRAFGLGIGDVVCFPRMRWSGRSFSLDVGHSVLSGPDLWRFLGYWCGDGGAPITATNNYPVKLHLGESKSFFVEDAKRVLSLVTGGRNVAEIRSPSRHGSIDLMVSSHKDLWGALRDFVGMSDERGVPISWMEDATDEDLRNFLVGVFRTDGGPVLRADGVLSGWAWVGTSDAIAQDVLYAANRLGLEYGLDHRVTRRYGVECKPQWSVRIKSSAVSRVLEAGDLDGLRLPEVEVGSKVWFDGDWVWSAIRKIEEKEYEGPVYDLRMDGDPSFATPAGIMLHNCQSSSSVDYLIQAAMQGAMSEPNSMVIVLSTFHFPIGLFQELWDYAAERGFSRFNWNCYDSMEQCDEGLSTATPEDPEALEFCRTQCPLTEKKPQLDQDGTQIGWEFTGCNGHGRHSEGFQTRANLILAKKMNRGTDVFENEYENNRPKWMRPIYDPSAIDRIIVPVGWPMTMVEGEDEEAVAVAETMGGIERFAIGEKSVGVDWGLEGQTALVMCALINFTRPRLDPSRLPDAPPVDWCIGIMETEFLSGKLASEAIKVLMMWQEKYGADDFFVYGDASHPFNNLEVEQSGFNMTPVQFNKWKDYGVGNCVKYLHTPGKLFIRANLYTFLDQIKRYRRDRHGKPIKKDDHGPDAWMSYLDAKIRVMTRSGWVPVGKIRVGTEVLTHAGRFRPVTKYEPSLYRRGRHVVVNFVGRTHSVNAHRVTLEHPFQLEDGSWVEAENLKPGMRVRCLASRCVRCGMKIPWLRKFCDGCVGKGRNARWKNPGERERAEAEKKAEILRSEYATGVRDAATNARAATAARADMIRSNPGEREKVREHLRAILPLVNTPEKRGRQSRLMKTLHAREGFFDHLRIPEGRERARRQVVARMIADRQVPFNCRLRHFTDIEREMFDSFVGAGFEPVHNLRVGRWFVDIALPELKVAVECDGGNWHNSKEARERDAKKDAYLRGHGWEVFRFSGKRIKGDVDGCRDEVLRVASNHEGLYEFTSVEVASVKIVEMKRPRTAYHFEVEEDQSYVARGIVSHNCSMLHFRFEDRFHSEEAGIVAPEPIRKARPSFPHVSPDQVMRQASEFGVFPPMTPGGAIIQHAPMKPPQGSPLDNRGRSGKTGGSVIVI